ncbi:MAG: thioredoxin family protein [Candidatus Latescibacterota bacterium]
MFRLAGGGPGGRTVALPLALWALLNPVCPAGAESPHPVQARLLTDVAAVDPERPFHVGVELRMAPQWHTYWAFSGDAGMPTRVEWSLSPGLEAGPVQWPVPHRYQEAGDLTSYGYADSVLLASRLTPGPAWDPGDSVRVGARVSWLVCREVCIPGDTTLSLALPVSAGDAPPAHEAVFSAWAAHLPEALPAGLSLQPSVRRGEGQIVVDLALVGARLEVGEHTPEFYPLAAEGFAFRAERAGDSPPRLRLVLDPYGEEDLSRLQGLLVYSLAGQARRRGSPVELDLAAAQGAVPSLGLFAGAVPAAPDPERALSLYLLLAAAGGLLLNLMPCVLPVISLKVLSFVSQAGEERRRVRWLGLAFSAGIVATFLVLAGAVGLLKAGGEQIGWGFQFQHPEFVAGMAGLVFALGLSLFGLFTINASAGRLAGLAAREGLLGSFLNGVLATVLATPCTAPFLGTALGFAFAQSTPVIWAVFAAVGVGMALPYLVLALQPGWMRFLPRPGAWMVRFEELMGFLLMGTVLWLLWVLGRQVGVDGVIWTAGFLLCVALACWLVGRLLDLRSGRLRRSVVWALALLLVAGGWNGLVAPAMKGGPSAAADALPAVGDWQPFAAQRVQDLVAAGRPVFIDFTADWCWTCKVNERTVLADERVRSRLAALDFALVRADWTSRNPEITAALRAFGRSGVPLYVILPAGRPDAPLVLPEVITTGVVLDGLERAAALGRGSG